MKELTRKLVVTFGPEGSWPEFDAVLERIEASCDVDIQRCFFPYEKGQRPLQPMPIVVYVGSTGKKDKEYGRTASLMLIQEVLASLPRVLG